MPVKLQVIQASEFVRLNADEHLDFEATKMALQSLARMCRERRVNCAMMDLREMPVLKKRRFTPTQLAALVGTFREAGFSRQQRLAILYRRDVFGGIRVFAFISRLRGLRVQSFIEYETAMQWLLETPPESDAPVPKRPGKVRKSSVKPAGP